MDPQLTISFLTTIIILVGIGWFGLDRMRADIKADAKTAHDAIGKNIDSLREDIRELRNDLGQMRTDVTDMNGRLGRVEGLLEQKSPS